MSGLLRLSFPAVAWVKTFTGVAGSPRAWEKYPCGCRKPVWNLFKLLFLLLHLLSPFNTKEASLSVPGSGCSTIMIVCSCNVLTDHDVRSVVDGAADLLPRSPNQVYGCLGCSAQCGRCARTIRKIMTEALGACAKSCCEGCPHSAAQPRTTAAGPVAALPMPPSEIAAAP